MGAVKSSRIATEKATRDSDISRHNRSRRASTPAEHLGCCFKGTGRTDTNLGLEPN